jgi:hypothetical protein
MKPQIALKLSLLSLGLAFTAGLSRAQDAANSTPPPPAAPDTVNSDGTQPPPPPPEHRRGHGMMLEELTQKLGLTPDQQKQVGEILKAGREELKALHDDDSMSDEDKRAKMAGPGRPHARPAEDFRHAAHPQAEAPESAPGGRSSRGHPDDHARAHQLRAPRRPGNDFSRAFARRCVMPRSR